jgi:uncharacterized protein (UPF0303 family)
MPIDRGENEEHRRRMLKAGALYLAAKVRLRAGLLVMLALIDEGVFWAAMSGRDADNQHWNKTWRRAVREVAEANSEAVKQAYAFLDHQDRFEGRDPPESPPLENI